MSDVEELIRKVQALNIQQRQTVSDLIEAITSNKAPIPVSSPSVLASRRSNRITNNQFISSKCHPLAIGDKVRILNNRKTGKSGDTATVLKFNKNYVALSLDKNHSYTQRDSKNLDLIEDDR